MKTLRQVPYHSSDCLSKSIKRQLVECPTPSFSHNSLTFDDRGLKKHPTRTFSDFNILSHLGSGATSEVYKVEWNSQVFAMKTIDLRHKNSETLYKLHDMITHEILIMMAAQDHPNIPCFEDVYFVDSQVHIVMEYIKGYSLKDLLKMKCKFEEKEILEIMIQIVKTLDFVHNQLHIVHQDLTLGNIMVSEKGKVYLTDFGCSTTTTQSNQDLFNATQINGTQIYMGPERLKRKSFGFDTDIWSLGMCMLAMKEGRLPTSQCQDLFELMMQVQILTKSPFSMKESFYGNHFREMIQHCVATTDKRWNIKQLMSSSYVQKFDFPAVEHNVRIMIRNLIKNTCRNQL